MTCVACVAAACENCFPQHMKVFDMLHVEYVNDGLADLESSLVEELVLQTGNELISTPSAST